MEKNLNSVEYHPDLPRPAVLCTIVRIHGSAPQQVGAKMWVCAERFVGTIGGGAMEHQAMALAREMLKSPKPEPQVKEFKLNEEAGLVCGGKAEVFFEPLPSRKSIHLFGGGHVGRAAAAVFAQMPFDLHVIDARAEWAVQDAFPPEAQVHCAAPVEYVRSREWTADDAACVFTHSHDVDFPIAAELAGRPLGYLGVIGSKNKAREFQDRIRREKGEALAKAWQEHVRCPIGLPLPSKNPKVIAVAVAAQLLQEWGLGK
ncbi:MAG TPA: xanthine dehydrogenase accessory protein XdhC [Elusimicrobia bacterium]|nr:xanthine dehydrogenase accessory protein XdhC [Elusimicrobiota bacterium]